MLHKEIRNNIYVKKITTWLPLKTSQPQKIKNKHVKLQKY